MSICTGIEIMGTNLTIADWLVYPTTCAYYFYAGIFFALFIAITLWLYNRERESFIQPDLISSIGVSATAVFFLSIIATLIQSTNGTPMLQQDIFLYILALWIVIAGIWFFKT